MVLYNSSDTVIECLRSVAQELQPGCAELIVVDNASPDDSAAIVQREFPEALLIRSDSNRHFAGGCNLSWPFTRGRYWLLLNPDVVVPPGGLMKLVEWMDRHPQLGAASPAFVDERGAINRAARRFPGMAGSLLELLRLHKLLTPARRAELLLGQYWSGTEHLDVDWVPGTALIVRREAVEKAGLLSEQVPMYGEDCEWCWRLKQAGWKIGVCGGPRFIHNEGQSALRTWGAVRRKQLMWAGGYGACRVMRGAWYTVVLIALQSIAYLVESCLPWRSATNRSDARENSRIHLALLSAAFSRRTR